MSDNPSYEPDCWGAVLGAGITMAALIMLFYANYYDSMEASYFFAGVASVLYIITTFIYTFEMLEHADWKTNRKRQTEQILRNAVKIGVLDTKDADKLKKIIR